MPLVAKEQLIKTSVLNKQQRYRQINDKINELTSDDEVTATMKGIYLYIITGDGKNLNIR